VLQGARIDVRIDLDGAVARRTRVRCRQATYADLIDETVHIDLDLRDHVSLSIPTRLAGFLPHAEALVDLCCVFKPLGREKIAGMLES
jgi:hypothetical protein